MHTYCIWRNAHPRDCKISDAEMAKLLAFVLLLPGVWVVTSLGGAFEALSTLRGRKHISISLVARAVVLALLVPLAVAWVLPRDAKAWWHRITD